MERHSSDDGRVELLVTGTPLAMYVAALVAMIASPFSGQLHAMAALDLLDKVYRVIAGVVLAGAVLAGAVISGRRCCF